MERHDRASEGRKERAARPWERPAQLLVAILVLAGGCGGDDGGSGAGRQTPNTATPTATGARPTQTSATTPTATPSPSPSTPVEPSATSTVTATPTPRMSPSPESCDVTDPCPAGELCELPVGVCASGLDAGACVDVPFVCFDEIVPVCGCDGLTYGSDCLRRGASVQKAHDGPCPAEECGDACDCYATRTFAVSCPLECATCDSYWTCEEKRCLEHCGPVPPDRCEALCFDNEPCGPEAFCRKPVGRCDGLGACGPRPQECPNVVDPVCGCDGQTYSNECEAGKAGVAVAHRGACEVEPTPTPSPSPEPCDVTDPCPTGQFCELPVGVCGSGLDSGTCVDVPFFCFDEIAPVCGCDGLTYGSDCLRRGARAQKAHDGPCPEEECRDDCDCYATRAFAVSCPLDCANCDNYWACEESRCIERCGPFPPDRCEALCFENGQCGHEEYCAKPVGHCDGLGSCRPRSEVCPEVIDPVCGCDGQTYSNECRAGNAGVAVAHHGPCEEEPTPTPTPPASPTPEPCDVTDPCPAREFCELPAGVCATDLDRGTCVAIPDFCFDPDELVCGCDGLTYGSDCLRRSARVQKSSDGPCPTTECGGPCDCYATRPFAAQCPLLCPSCGNFWTCENERCIEHCGMIPLDLCAALCTDNEQCPSGEYCQKPIGHCDGLGACRPRPEQCPDVVDPVCGCDGRTYSNECDAGNLGITIAHRGECRPRCGTIAGIPCPQGQFCEYPPASCDVADPEGACLVPPEACPLVVDPVCGCDGVTYSNDCERQRARAQLDHRGACGDAVGKG